MSSPFVVAALTSVAPIPVTSGGTGVSTSTGAGQVVLSNTPTLITPVIGAATGTSLSLSGSISANAAILTTPLSVASGGTGVGGSTGTGSVVLSISPSLVTPTLGVASATSLSLTNALPVLSGGTGTTTSTGSGSVVLSTSPTLSGTAICDVMNGGIITAASFMDAGSRIGTTQPFAGPNTGGTFLSYNKNSDGVSHFLNQRGGGTGGFSWLAYNSANSLTSTPMTLAPSGDLSIIGSLNASSAILGSPLPVSSGGTGVTSGTGTGSNVLNTSPTLVTPALGAATATSLSLSSALPVLSGGTGVTTSTGTGSVVLSSSPTLAGTAVCDVLNGAIITAASFMDAGSRIGTTQPFAGPNAGGTFLSWNKNSDGVSHFLNQRGGGTGGFSWLAYNNSNTLTSTPMTLAPSGDLTIIGAFSASTATLGSPLPVLSGGTGVTSSTGTGSNVLSAAPTLTGSVIVNGTISVTQSSGGGISILNTSATAGIDGLTIYAPNGNNIGFNLGNSASTGNSVQLYYNQTSNNSAANFLALGFSGKSPNVQFFNNQLSQFNGIRNIASGIYTTGVPDMSTQGFGIGWNQTGNGDSIFYNNNANGTVPGGWNWRPCTNSTIGSPVMTLSQSGDLNIVGNITANNLSFESGSWTPFITSRGASNNQLIPGAITMGYAVGKYWRTGKQVTVYFSLDYDTSGIVGVYNIIIAGIPEAIRYDASFAANSNSCTIYGTLDPIKTNMQGASNPIKFSLNPWAQSYANGTGQIYGIAPYVQGPYKLNDFNQPGSFSGTAVALDAVVPAFAYTNQNITGFVTYQLP